MPPQSIPPPESTPIPVTVLAGADRTAKRRLLARLLAIRPKMARWAVLDNAAAAGIAAAAPGGPDVERFAVPGGCACCIAGPAFSTALVRLLRAGPWQRVLVDVDPAGHAHAIVDQLRSAPFDRLLRVTRLLVPVTGVGCAAGPGDPDAVEARLGFASDFLLVDEAGGAPLAAAAQALERAGPWPRRRVADGDRRQSAADQRAGQAPGDLGQTAAATPDLPLASLGWPVFSALAPGAIAGERLLARSWPGEAVAQRRAMLDMLESVMAAPEVTGLIALVRTPRAWYRWAWGRVDGPPPLIVDQPGFTEAETSWRLDNRLVLGLAAGADRGRADALLELPAGVLHGA